MRYLVRVFNTSSNASKYLHDISLLGYKLDRLEQAKVYMLEGNLKEKDVRLICEELLADPILERYEVNGVLKGKGFSTVNIWYRPEVLDVVAMNVLKAIRYMGIKTKLDVRSGVQLRFYPRLRKETVDHIVKNFFMNELIQYHEVF